MENTNNQIDLSKGSDDINFQSRLDLSSISEACEKIKAKVSEFIIGQEKLIALSLVAIISDGHILIEGAPGLAKTLAAKVIAKTIDCAFKRIQFTPDLMPSDILGSSVFNPKTIDFEFKKGPIFSNIVLIDEINRAPAKTQSALLEAMEERQITADGAERKLESPFLVFATQNPIEQEGTYRLPEAQIDRFLFKINIGYPTLQEEIAILEMKNINSRIDLSAIKPIIDPARLQEIRDIAQKVRIDEKIIRYIAEITQKTRNNPSIYVGASPRASIALLTASKALAAINGRDFVTPDDVKFVVEPALNHRIILTSEIEMEGITTGEVLTKIIETIDVPR